MSPAKYLKATIIKMHRINFRTDRGCPQPQRSQVGSFARTLNGLYNSRALRDRARRLLLSLSVTFAAPGKSGRGQPHSETCRNFGAVATSRSVLECGCPLPLLTGAKTSNGARLITLAVAVALTLSACK